jgi:CRISPR-associated endonuclease/helicase Cas3
MENALLSSNLYSHPDKLLETHLINVANFAKDNLNQAPINKLLGLDKQILYDVLNIASLCHDIGKSTDYFQYYLFANEKEKQTLKNKPETHHSLLSAIVTFYETEAYMNTKGTQSSNFILPFIAYLTVKRHHGDFDDAKYEMVLEENDILVLKNQIEHTNETALYNLNNHLRVKGLLVDISKEQLFKWVSNFQKDAGPIKREIRKLKDEKNFEILTKILYKATKNQSSILRVR